METPLFPQVLLQHGQFVRALARSLLRDAHAAEDVAQETWVRYLERTPEAHGGMRQWLRVVARNLAVNRGRVERSRAERDRAAARPEALPSVDEEVEHGELLGVVVAAVLALDEPYRATILGRYYQGLDAESLAAQSGTTAATVRSREHRALEKLRAELDRRCKGARGAWAAVLARIAGPLASEGGVAPPSAWSSGLKVAATLLVVTAGVVSWRMRSSQGASRAENVASAANAPASVPPPVVEPAALAPAAAPAETRSPIDSSSSSGSSALTNASSEVRGRFVFPDGAPAARVPIQMHGWGGNQSRKMLHGVPADWVDPQGETDDDGRFSLSVDPPRAFQFTLRAKAPGHAEASWRWSEIQTGSVVDVGEVELPVGGTIEGRIVDAQGAPLLGEEWVVYGRTVGLGEHDGRDDSQVFAVVHPATASFRLEDVWPTSVKLRADSDIANSIAGPAVTVRSGETVTADIVYSGPSNARRITVVTFSEPFYVMNSPDPEHIRLLGPAGEVRTAARIRGSSQSHSFDDLPPGTYTLEIDDPRYVPWRRDGLAPGQSVNADLVGNAALRLSVVDGTGEAVERYAVRVLFRNARFRPNEFEVHDGKRALEDGLVRGMFPGDYTIAIRCADGTTARCDVDALLAGETRAVQLELESQLFVAGRVVHDDGAGVADAEVLLLAPAAQDDSDASPIFPDGAPADGDDSWRRELAQTATDAEGSFRFDVTRSGPFVLRASAEGSQVFSPSFTLGGPRTDLELVLPMSGSVRGRVRGPAGASFEGLALWIAPAAFWTSDPPIGPAGLQRVQDVGESLGQAKVPLAADGSFELEHLPPGPSHAFLVIAEAVDRGFGLADDGITGGQRLGELVVPAGGVLERDFDVQDLPGSVVLEVRMGGAPAAGLEVTLTMPDPPSMRMERRTDADGRLGPVRMWSGVAYVWAFDEDAGWSGGSTTPVFIEPGRETSTTIDFVLSTGTLQCVDANGQPLAGEAVYVRPDHERSLASGWWRAAPHTTDDEGRIELELVPGAYLIQRGVFAPGKGDAGAGHFTWTESGSLEERVQL